MDRNRRKELVNQYKDRHPDMGVVCICCTPTGERFLTTTKDVSTGYNRHRFQLSAGAHPNRPLQALWKTYGEDAFTYSVIEKLNYDDPAEVGQKDLDELLGLCLASDPEDKKL